MPNAIDIENLTYAYGKSEAVHGLNLTVRPGGVTQWCGKDDDDEMPPEFVAAAKRFSSGFWHGSCKT
jgi:hypothetical protein